MTKKNSIFGNSGLFGNDFDDVEEEKPIEQEIITNPKWEDYDWQDWAEFWRISIEQTKINFENAETEEDKISLIRANQTIQKQAEEEREKLAKREAEKAKYQAYLKECAAEKKAQQFTSLFENTTSYSPTPKDKSETKRYELSQEIRRKESDIDDLRHLTNKFQEENDYFLSGFKRDMDETHQVLEQNSQFDTRQAQRNYEIYQGVQAKIKSKTQAQLETLETSTRSTRQTLEGSIDRLHRERNNLPW